MNTPNQTPDSECWGPAALHEARESKRKYQNAAAQRQNSWIESNGYYYDRLKSLLRFIVEPGKSILGVRCGTGDLLAAVEPSHCVGVEIGDAMVALARSKHPGITFLQADPESLNLDKTFDYILFDHVLDTVDILGALEQVRRHSTPSTRIILITQSNLWEPVLRLAEKLGLSPWNSNPDRIGQQDMRGFLDLAGFRTVQTHRLFLLPKKVPFISDFFNNILARLPGLRRLCFLQVIVARPNTQPKSEKDVSVSVIVPCRNERGNIEVAVERIPEMGCHTEIVFCDDKSTDGTGDEVRRVQALYPERDIRLVEGPGICKAENVWTGFRASSGDVMMILDADLAVMPEELPTFLKQLVNGQAEFINGTRLIYPMRRGAMKFANSVGNKVFGWLFSFLLDQRITDTLCGTKVLWRRDWHRIEENIGMWGVRDLWGDYELLFGARKLNLEISEMPVHYQERVYGTTKMNKVFANGIRMLRICFHAWLRLGGQWLSSPVRRRNDNAATNGLPSSTSQETPSEGLSVGRKLAADERH